MTTNARFKLNHEENRGIVCAQCGEKIIFGKSLPNSMFVITARLERLLVKFSNPKYSLSNIKFLTAICGTCRHTLCDYEKNIKTRKMVKMPDFEKENVITNSTRNIQNEVCACRICTTARFKER